MQKYFFFRSNIDFYNFAIENPDELFSILIMEKPDLEQFLISWISLHLNKGLPVDPVNTLATYGIDSLKAVLLSEDTRNMFGFDWPPYLFFEELSITQLAAEGRKLMQDLK